MSTNNAGDGDGVEYVDDLPDGDMEVLRERHLRGRPPEDLAGLLEEESDEIAEQVETVTAQLRSSELDDRDRTRLLEHALRLREFASAVFGVSDEHVAVVWSEKEQEYREVDRE